MRGIDPPSGGRYSEQPARSQFRTDVESRRYHGMSTLRVSGPRRQPSSPLHSCAGDRSLGDGSQRSQTSYSPRDRCRLSDDSYVDVGAQAMVAPPTNSRSPETARAWPRRPRRVIRSLNLPAAWPTRSGSRRSTRPETAPTSYPSLPRRMPVPNLRPRSHTRPLRRLQRHQQPSAPPPPEPSPPLTPASPTTPEPELPRAESGTIRRPVGRSRSLHLA